MNILHVVKEFSAPTQTFIYDLVCALEREQGLSNSVFTFKPQVLATERPFARVYECKRLAKGYFSTVRRICFKLQKKKIEPYVLERLVAEQSPDLIHCHFAWTYWDGLLPFYCKMQTLVPLVISTHGTDITIAMRDPSLRRALQEISRKNGVFFAATTEFMSGQLIELGIAAEKIKCIPNSVNSMFFEKRKNKHFSVGQEFNIINNSRFVEWKGHKYLIEAFARFVDEVYENSRLTLIGEGRLREALESQAASLGVAGKIEFVGNLSHSRVPDLLRASDLYIQPSILDERTGQQESFGIAVLEAICVGLPVIVTNTGGMPYLIGSENIFAHLVAPGNSERLFMKMRDVFLDQGAFHDNYVYAHERFSCYSRESQVRACTGVYQQAKVAV